ncbi:alkylphosphocholine resistance protein lem3 [Coniosporium apollinis]|uniref:Alkylphosphocholine resistance protein lem3 n=1 Tax=Coniosporium apollinis TaxID=61459 RepID=A0ABQ9NUM4_9PEZI|nr:alkylphosphocholine resistance protein lem3 [Coniosporium apollinis]
MSTTQVQHTDSAENQGSRSDDKQKTKSRRPANTAFRQQRLKAWQPILTPKTVLPLFFVVGIIFAPIGGLLIWASSEVEEISIDYSSCIAQAPLSANFPPEPSDFRNIPSDLVHSSFKPSNYPSQPAQWAQSRDSQPYHGGNLILPDVPVCTLRFDIPNNIGPPVLFYYRLTNFYQNHRRYVKSLDTQQLMGNAQSNASISASDCDPLQVDEATGKAYYPCGLIANSLFNDTFTSPNLTNPSAGAEPTYNMSQRGIAWDSDKELYQQTRYTIDQVVPPKNWKKRYPNGYTETEPLPDLHNDEAFQVWMRTAGLPTFSKLAMRNDTAPMPIGRYQLSIYDHFNVTLYGGTKSILISTRTVMGGKNPFLGIAYIVVGGICILLGAIFTATHLIKPRKLGDHTYLTWNNDQPSTATATGRSARPGDSA